MTSSASKSVDVKYNDPMTYTKESVLSFLQKSHHQEISNIASASGGDWSQAFFYEVGGQSKVIRFSKTDEDFLKDRFAYRYNSPALPIPKIEEIGQVSDGFYAISQKIEGEMVDNLTGEQMARFTPQIFSLFNSLRLANISDTTGYGGWSAEGKGANDSWREFLASVNIYDSVSRVDWRDGLSSREETRALFDRVYQELTGLLEYCPEDRHLIHNDLLHFNLITNENRVVGVIDWGCSLYGDFLYDLAMFDLWKFYYPSMACIDWKGEVKKYFENIGVELPNFDKRLKCYQCHLALDAIKYTVFKNNEKDLKLITDRIKEIIS